MGKRLIRESTIRKIIRESIKENGGRVDEGIFTGIMDKLKSIFSSGDDKEIKKVAAGSEKEGRTNVNKGVASLFTYYLDEDEVDSEEEFNEKRSEAKAKVMKYIEEMIADW